MKKAVHFGAGNIGRGFIGSLLYKSGYDIYFVDVFKELVDNINKFKSYNIFILGNDIKKEVVDGVKAIHIDDEKNLLKAIEDADVITTSVGVNNLYGIGEKLAYYLERRFEKNDLPLDIMACENALFATNILRDSIYKNSSETLKAYLDEKIGFPNTAVDRIVPNVDIEKETPIDVAVEEFFEWDIEKDAVKGDFDIKGCELVDDLEPYIERKLFLLNGSHATTAYLGYLKGYKYIHEAILDETIDKIVKNLQLEASFGLNNKHKIGIDKLKEYSDKVIERFKNPHLKDEVVRVGRDPVRKLSNGDRLVSPAKLSFETGLMPENILYGIAAGFAFDYKDDPKAMEIQESISTLGLEETVKKVTGLDETILIDKIVKKYKELKSGKIK
ncbi:Mannitol-1-phosphate 5-dehydrogenase [Thermoanaerobacterium xylanolyticum LX-11]|uniref:Mannitol-1-phosphate 5-dehydrogenase n=1 Tax=Thermoanaerobacterium xylanolyticum (strain ATCC 49914 / DSM 7097 / LX-11) TaxID=858215 RepID=F6BJS6_THEXL|nr:mannitol-1-phosphate 5-dehydrogenase [Thermoanaerobacterium xylanolyticum]AEF16983.1 Mannitol-1-phosphate 5-dehydrogenase [Thermoanaerobacterium xylanolyticum LX-11]